MAAWGLSPPATPPVKTAGSGEAGGQVQADPLGGSPLVREPIRVTVEEIELSELRAIWTDNDARRGVHGGGHGSRTRERSVSPPFRRASQPGAAGVSVGLGVLLVAAQAQPPERSGSIPRWLSRAAPRIRPLGSDNAADNFWGACRRPVAAIPAAAAAARPPSSPLAQRPDRSRRPPRPPRHPNRKATRNPGARTRQSGIGSVDGKRPPAALGNCGVTDGRAEGPVLDGRLPGSRSVRRSVPSSSISRRSSLVVPFEHRLAHRAQREARVALAAMQVPFETSNRRKIHRGPSVPVQRRRVARQPAPRPGRPRAPSVRR